METAVLLSAGSKHRASPLRTQEDVSTAFSYASKFEAGGIRALSSSRIAIRQGWFKSVWGAEPTSINL